MKDLSVPTIALAIILCLSFSLVLGQTDRPPAKPDFANMPHDTLKTMAEQYWRAATTAIADTKKQKDQIAGLMAEVAKLKADLVNKEQELEVTKRELGKWKPTTIADDSGLLTITISQLDNMGEKYLGKRVRMVLQYLQADQGNIDQLPGVTIRDNGLVSVVNAEAFATWIGFGAQDEQQNLTNYNLFAMKKDYGEMLTQMKRGTPIVIEGFVVKLRQASSYGLCCDKIQPVVGD